MKRIHFVLKSGVYPKRTGGMEIFNYHLIKTIRDQYNISYSAYSPLNFNKIKHHRLFPFKPSKVFEPIQLLFFLLFHRQIQTIVYSFSRDHWLTWHLYRIISVLFKIDYVVVIHLGQKPCWDSKSHYIRRFLQKAKTVIAVSSDIKQNYDFVFGIDCDLIYPLVPFNICESNRDDLRSKYHIPQDSFVICMIGTIKKMKNPDTIIKAISLMSVSERNEIKPFVVFAGGGNLIPELKEMAENLGVKDEVLFLGNIPKEQVNEIYHMSDIYLMASDYEGTSVSLLEALFNSKPIIASKATGIIDMIKDGSDCIMFKTQDANELKDKVLFLAKSPMHRYRLGNNAKQTYMKKYDYQNVVTQYKEKL
ncbi:MAG: glycosyltransferase family 4 protein [Bacteroides sp.]|uniref:glycosyltransferase family 4 protein n=1 Tax=Bacteroides sp. TaxID=29523 RepID=UPI002FC7EEE4